LGIGPARPYGAEAARRPSPLPDPGSGFEPGRRVTCSRDISAFATTGPLAGPTVRTLEQGSGPKATPPGSCG